MVYRPSKIPVWLPLAAIALLSLGAFASVSDPWDRVLTGVGSALVLAYLGIDWWEKRRARKADQSSSAAISSRDQM
jgi:threonine/homoserine/homoserine lactone efflux protein